MLLAGGFHLGHEFLALLLGRLDHAHANQALAEEVAHLANALAFHVHHGHGTQHLQGFGVLGDLHHAGQGAHGGRTLAAGGRADVHVDVKLGLAQVVGQAHLAGLLVDHGLHQGDGGRCLVVGDDLHGAAFFHVDLLGHGQPDLAAALHGLGKVAHVDEGLHVHALLDHLHGLAADVADHLFSAGLVAQNVLHVLLGHLQQPSQRRWHVGCAGVGHRAADRLAAVWAGDRVDQQVRVVLEVVL